MEKLEKARQDGKPVHADKRDLEGLSARLGTSMRVSSTEGTSASATFLPGCCSWMLRGSVASGSSLEDSAENATEATEDVVRDCEDSSLELSAANGQ